MITSCLAGGLCNFLFQIAAIQSLAIDNKDIAIFDFDLATQRHKNIYSYRSDILRNVNIGKVTPINVYNEPNFHYNNLPYLPNYLYNGYFQCEKYFIHNREIILELFSPTNDTIEYINKKYFNLLNGETCSIHVRRTDYVDRYSEYHPPCTIEYYKAAINEIKDCDKFLIFSDDINWCKQNFIGNKFTFIENERDVIDLYLMSKCKNNIIANSSFSWWGTWLNINENKKIIAPKKWFGPAKPLNTNDIYPKNCIIL